MNAVEPIEAEPGGSPREYIAVFFDEAGHETRETITVTMRCSTLERRVCGGICTYESERNCGACGRSCPTAEDIEGIFPICRDGRCGFRTRLPFRTPTSCRQQCDDISDVVPTPVRCSVDERGCSRSDLPRARRAGCAWYEGPWNFYLDVTTCDQEVLAQRRHPDRPALREHDLTQLYCSCFED